MLQSIDENNNKKQAAPDKNIAENNNKKKDAPKKSITNLDQISSRAENKNQQPMKCFFHTT